MAARSGFISRNRTGSAENANGQAGSVNSVTLSDTARGTGDQADRSAGEG